MNVRLYTSAAELIFTSVGFAPSTDNGRCRRHTIIDSSQLE
jgi:hypothetical protein